MVRVVGCVVQRMSANVYGVEMCVFFSAAAAIGFRVALYISGSCAETEAVKYSNSALEGLGNDRGVNGTLLVGW